MYAADAAEWAERSSNGGHETYRLSHGFFAPGKQRLGGLTTKARAVGALAPENRGLGGLIGGPIGGWSCYLHGVGAFAEGNQAKGGRNRRVHPIVAFAVCPNDKCEGGPDGKLVPLGEGWDSLGSRRQCQNKACNKCVPIVLARKAVETTAAASIAELAARIESWREALPADRAPGWWDWLEASQTGAEDSIALATLIRGG